MGEAAGATSRGYVETVVKRWLLSSDELESGIKELSSVVVINRDSSARILVLELLKAELEKLRSWSDDYKALSSQKKAPFEEYRSLAYKMFDLIVQDDATSNFL